MKVYQLSLLGKPPGRFSEWASLDLKKKDQNSDRYDSDNFNGRPYPLKWKPVELYIPKPRLPRPDFYEFGQGVFVCNERAALIAGEAMEMTGELLPVSVEGETGKFYVYNCTNCLNVLDKKNSTYEDLVGDGSIMGLEQPAFIASRFGEETLFKVPEDFGIEIYCLELTGNPDDGEFKAVVEQNGLTGLEFELVWSTGKEKIKSRKKSRSRSAS
jgi:hypothetical protein